MSCAAGVDPSAIPPRSTETTVLQSTSAGAQNVPSLVPQGLMHFHATMERLINLYAMSREMCTAMVSRGQHCPTTTAPLSAQAPLLTGYKKMSWCYQTLGSRTLQRSPTALHSGHTPSCRLWGHPGTWQPLAERPGSIQLPSPSQPLLMPRQSQPPVLLTKQEPLCICIWGTMARHHILPLVPFCLC